MLSIPSPDIFPTLSVVNLNTACLVSIAAKLTADNHRLFTESNKKSETGKALADALFCMAKNNLKAFRMAVDKRAALFMAHLWRRVAQIDKRQNRAIKKILMHRPVKGRAATPARPVWLVAPGSPVPRTRLKHAQWVIMSRIP